MKAINFLPIIFALPFILLNCTGKVKKEEQVKKILFINSYHAGYAFSDDIMDGIESTLKDKDIVLKTFFMDTKRNHSESDIGQKVEEVLTAIEGFKPDLIIASDDNAVKYVIAPYFKDKKIPVVFCGVNWSVEQYGFPVSNITGMIEVVPLTEAIDTMKAYYPNCQKMMLLAENTTSELKNVELLSSIYENAGLKVDYALVEDFKSWKGKYKAGQDYDLILISSNGAIKNWNEEEAISFVKENTLKPSFTCNDFMMPYSMFGLTKVPKEQGIWAGQTALEILNGNSPAEIPMIRKSQTQAWINQDLADKINFQPGEALKNRVSLYEE